MSDDASSRCAGHQQLNVSTSPDLDVAMTTVQSSNIVYPYNAYPPADYPNASNSMAQPPPAYYYGQSYPVAGPVSSHGDSERGSVNWGNSFSDKKIRHAFIRKVYFILLLQLSITVGIICLFLFCEPVKKWVQDNGYVYWISYVIFIVTYITIACCPGVRRKFPANFIFLLIFTLAFSYMAATISSYYDTDIVLIGIGVTAGLCLGISLFAVQTKIDFTLCSGLLFALSLTVIYSGTICLILFLCGYPYLLNCLYGGLVAMLFSLLLVFDTQRVVGGDRENQLSEEEYIFGALEIYIDVVNLLLAFLICSNR